MKEDREANISFESRRLALQGAYKKAISALVDVKQVAGVDFLTEVERDLIEFVRVMLVRKFDY